MIGALSFVASLAQAAGTIRRLMPALVPLAVHDPLRLNMPTIGGVGDGGTPAPASLDVFGALYLQAEMEQAGVIPVAEALAEQRATMPINSDEAAGRLEKFAANMRGHWHDRAYRSQIFARAFGIGDGAASDQGPLVNHDFGRILAALCNALVQQSNPTPWNQGAVSSSAALAETCQELLQNLGERQYGSTLIAAASIQEELEAALNLLRDTAIQQAFNGRGVWDTIGRIMGSAAPDVGRMVHRGQCGQAVMHWLAQNSGSLGSSGSITLNLGDPVIIAAAQWLQATGLPSAPSTPSAAVAA